MTVTATTKRDLDAAWRTANKLCLKFGRLRDDFALGWPGGLRALEACEERADDLLAAIERAREEAGMVPAELAAHRGEAHP